MKRKIILLALIFTIFLSAGAVSANENSTDDIIATENIEIEQNELQANELEEMDEKTEVHIVASDINKNNKIKVEIKDDEEAYCSVDRLNYKFDNGPTKSLKYNGDNDGCIFMIPCNLDAGTHELTLDITDPFYKADPTKITFKITKKDPKIKASKYTTTNKHVILKATITYNGKKVNEGKVKFKIKGKSYTVNVKNGVATKKIKIKNGYYYYKATFTDKNYNTKSSGNYAIKGNKYYTLKTKGLNGKTYTIKIPFKKYLRLVEAKRSGDYDEISVKTGKKEKFVSSKDIYKTKTVYKWKKIKVLDYESFWDYGESYSYSTSKYYNNGWTYVGSYEKTYSDGYEHYSIFKKKVKTTKKVYVGYKNVYSSKSYPLRFTAGINENGKLYCRWDISRESQLKANLVIPHWKGKL